MKKQSLFIATCSLISCISWADDVSLAANTNINSQAAISVNATPKAENTAATASPDTSNSTLAMVNNNLQQNITNVSGNVSAAVDQQLSSTLALATENNVQGTVQQALSNIINSSIDTAISNSVQTAVTNNIADTIESTVNSNVTTALNDSLGLGL